MEQVVAAIFAVEVVAGGGDDVEKMKDEMCYCCFQQAVLDL